ncbi:hypothetical protein ACJQWK_09308 [Exserohilum turcicum]
MQFPEFRKDCLGDAREKPVLASGTHTRTDTQTKATSQQSGSSTQKLRYRYPTLLGFTATQIPGHTYTQITSTSKREEGFPQARERERGGGGAQWHDLYT